MGVFKRMNFRPFEKDTWKTGYKKFGWKGIAFPSIFLMWAFYYGWR